MKKILQFCLFIFCVNTIYSQTNCLNFTNLSSSNVTCYYGTNSNPYQNIGLVPNRHSAITTQGTDKNTCHNLMHIPNGDSSSVRLGNESIGAEAEAISYNISVDTNNFSILLLKYAVVLQDPSHTISQQPRFKLEILNQFDSLISPNCGFADFSAGYTTNGWNYCVVADTSIKIKGNGDTLINISIDTITYKDWTTIGFDLSQYHGMNIKVRLTSYDCSLGAHYGYAYFSLKCDTKNINVAGCNNNSVNTFRAPEGFNYKWYKISNPSNIVSTQRIVSLVADNSIYNCECSFIEDSNCIFNISVLSQVREPIADFNYNYSISNCKYNVAFNNTSFVSSDGTNPIIPLEKCETYLWYFHDGDTSTLANPTKTYNSFGAFPIMLIAGINNFTCQDTIVDTIYLSDFRNDIIITGDTIICAGDTTTLYSNDFLTYLWSTSDTTNYITLSPNSSTLLNLNTTDTNGCTYNKSINLIVNPDKSTSVSDTICKGIVYNRYGYNFNADTSGLYTLNLKTYLGCDSIVSLNLKVNPVFNDTIFASICNGTYYNLNGFNENNAGFYTQNLKSILGCDSIVNLSLKVNPIYNDTINASICKGTSYNMNGFNESSTGFYTQSLLSINGCDSIVSLKLTVNPIYNDTIVASICKGTSYNLNGFNESNAGFYTQSLLSYLGCDSIVNLSLKVNPIYNDTINASICKGTYYNLNGFNESNAGLYTQSLSSYLGCDSIVNLSLKVNPIYNDTVVASICKGTSYNMNGFNESDAGFYSQSLSSYLGCDSIVNLSLKVNPIYNDTIVASICKGTAYNMNGFNESDVGFYTQSLLSIDGCDSIVSLNLKVNPVFNDTIFASICKGTSYNLNGFNESNAGFYTQNLKSIFGCDSIVSLSLKVNPIYNDTIVASICKGTSYNLNGFNESNAGFYTQNLNSYLGCDSIVSLSLKVNPIYNDTINASICKGTSYNLNGFNESNAGFYSQNLKSILGCDSIVSLSLKVNPIYNDTINASICKGTSYNMNGFNESNAGFYSQNLLSYLGCDSIVSLNLKVNPIYNDTIVASICKGTSYNLNGFNESNAGFYPQNLKSILGCDSIVNLCLKVNPIYNDTIVANICKGTSYNLNGVNVSSAGFYTQNLKSILGCDSIVSLNLKVNPVYNDTINASICNGQVYSLNGFNEKNAGLYTQSLSSYLGCDSIVNLSIKVNPIYNDTINASICKGTYYNLNGFNESSTGFYTQSLLSIDGCDSIVSLNLKVNPVYNDTIVASICKGTSYNLNGFNESNAGFYIQNLISYLGCDSIVNLSLTVNTIYNDTIFASICKGQTYSLFGFNESNAGFYTQNLKSIFGCDSIVSLKLTVNPVYNDTIVASICKGQVYSLNGFNESNAGLYSQRLLSYLGCDSIVSLNLTVNPSHVTEIFDTICNNSSYNLNGFNVNSTGIYTLHLKTYLGCDSTVNLNLFSRIYNDTINASICKGEIYNQNGFNEKNTGIYIQKLKSIYGCDSTITLNLTVNPTYNDTITAVTCNGQSYNQNGFNENIAGTYTRQLKTINGCDSVITLKLYSPSYSDTIYASICQGEMYTMNGFDVMNPGIYYRELQSINGCDSTIFLNLHVKPIYNDTIEASICKGETYNQNGFIISEEGVYSRTLQNIYGCDSILTINLTINPNYKDTIFASICKGEVYHENGFYADSAGIYKLDLNCMYGCDSLVVLNLKAKPIYSDTIDAVICNGQIYNEYGFNENKTGLYIQHDNSFFGCDSTTYLNLSVIEHPKLDLFLNDEQVVDEFPITLDASCENCSEYYWSTGETTSTINVYSQGKYYITASNICGITYDSLLILTPEIALYLPNTFITSQMTNNSFGIYSDYKDKIEIISFKIYNRWGTIVFETNDIDKFWDGTYEGKYLNSDLFVWLLHYKTKYTGNKIFEKKGDVRLIR